MTDQWLIALFSLVGTVIGGGISVVVNMTISRSQARQERLRLELELATRLAFEEWKCHVEFAAKRPSALLEPPLSYILPNIILTRSLLDKSLTKEALRARLEEAYSFSNEVSEFVNQRTSERQAKNQIP